MVVHDFPKICEKLNACANSKPGPFFLSQVGGALAGFEATLSSVLHNLWCVMRFGSLFHLTQHSHKHTHTLAHTHAHAHTHVPMHTHMHTHTHTHTHSHTYVHANRPALPAVASLVNSRLPWQLAITRYVCITVSGLKSQDFFVSANTCSYRIAGNIEWCTMILHLQTFG